MKWKYKVIRLNNDAPSNAKLLDRVGSDGWELVTVHGDASSCFAYLKSEVVEPERRVTL